MKKILVFIFICYNISFSQLKKNELFKVNDSIVSIDEFNRVYNKNIDLINENSQKDFETYLDLFVNYNERSNGAGRLLIEEVAKHCKQRGVSRLYWKTQEHNYVGRILYDKVAKNSGFLEYEREI